MAENTVAPRFGGLHEEEAGGNGWRKVDERAQVLPEVQYHDFVVAKSRKNNHLNDTTAVVRW